MLADLYEANCGLGLEELVPGRIAGHNKDSSVTKRKETAEVQRTPRKKM
jgi:hypothetical protein